MTAALHRALAFYSAYIEPVAGKPNPSFMQSVMEGCPNWALFDGYSVVPPARAGDLSVAVVSAHAAACAAMIEKYGTDAQKKEAQSAMSLAITEPKGGSDLSVVETAVRDGRLSGSKSLVTGGAMAKSFAVAAVGLGNEEDRARLTMLLVPGDRAGIARAPRSCLGLADSGISDVSFDSVEIWEGDILGKPGDGYRILQAGLDTLRIELARAATAAARPLVDRAIAHASERVVFGAPLRDNAALKEVLAGLSEKLFAMEAAVSMTDHLARKGMDVSIEAALAKWFCSQAAWEIADDVMQILGGSGYADRDLGAGWRDLRALRLIGGSNEVLRFYIALQGGRSTAQFLIDTDKGRRRGSTFFDAIFRRTARSWRLALTRPKVPRLPKEIAEAGKVIREAMGILADRTLRVYREYGNDAAGHPYDMKRIGDLALETFVITASTFHCAEVLKTASDGDRNRIRLYPLLRGLRCWPRIAQTSSELYLSDEEAVSAAIPEKGA